MKNISFLISTLFLSSVIYSQSNKVIFGGKYSKYYNTFREKDDSGEHIEYDLKDSLPDGKYYYYNEKGTTYLMSEVEYKNKLKNKYFKTYYVNRQLKEEISYKAGKKKTEREFYEDGKIKHEANIFYKYDDNGQSKDYYQNGVISSIAILKNGIGNTKDYYENGKLKVEFSFLINKRNEICYLNTKTYYNNGNLKLLESYEKCDLNGFVYHFEENGAKEKEEIYSKGVKRFEIGRRLPTPCYNTVHIRYINGMLMLKGDYINCNKTGTWEYYDKESKLVKEEIYENDVLIKTINH